MKKQGWGTIQVYIDLSLLAHINRRVALIATLIAEQAELWPANRNFTIDTFVSNCLTTFFRRKELAAVSPEKHEKRRPEPGKRVKLTKIPAALAAQFDQYVLAEWGPVAHSWALDAILRWYLKTVHNHDLGKTAVLEVHIKYL